MPATASSSASRVCSTRRSSARPSASCSSECSRPTPAASPTPASSSPGRATPTCSRGGLPEDMTLELVEPLRSLFKDEVRRVGTELGLPDEIVWRQPFPGPGLGVRIIGEVTREKVALLQEADAVVREEIRLAGLEREI